MRTIFKLVIGLTLAPCVGMSTVFDAHDFLDRGKFSMGLLGEYVTNNPTGQGLELRLKYGVNQIINVQGIVGYGSDNRKFRTGAQTTLSIFPDVDGQFGVMTLLKTLYLRRDTNGALQISLIPLGHKRVSHDKRDFNFYFGVPLIIELNDGRYRTGSQILVGVLFNIDEAFFAATEFGVGIANFETYLSAGGGYRF